MSEQLSLFSDENTLFNTGLQRLFEMDFRGCLETLEHYFTLFPWGRETSKETMISKFWLEKLGSQNERRNLPRSKDATSSGWNLRRHSATPGQKEA